MTLARIRPNRDDSGITLVELIIYVLLAALFLGLTAGIFAAGLSAETKTRDRDTATGKAQVIGETLQTGFRNADQFQIETGGTQLRARVSLGTGAWGCRAWVITNAGDMLYRQEDAPIALTGVVASAPGAIPAGWTSLIDADINDTELSATVSGQFSQDASRLVYQLTVTAGDSEATLDGGALPQAQPEGAVLTCW